MPRRAQAFVENYPEFRKMSGTVSKHVALMSELSRVVDSRALMEVSQVEQELACTENHSSAVAEVESLLANRAVSPEDKLRLVLLYALRYEGSEANAIHRFVDMLGASGVPPERLRLIPAILEQCGARSRCGDLFSNKSFFAVAKKQLQRGIKGVQNVYTQHTPYLAQTLESLAKNKLPVSARPPCRGARGGAVRAAARGRAVAVALSAGSASRSAAHRLPVLPSAHAHRPSVKLPMTQPPTRHCDPIWS